MYQGGQRRSPAVGICPPTPPPARSRPARGLQTVLSSPPSAVTQHLRPSTEPASAQPHPSDGHRFREFESRGCRAGHVTAGGVRPPDWLRLPIGGRGESGAGLRGEAED
jgi:hypothetical protein